MYAAATLNGNIVAIHKKLHAVERYVECSNKDLQIIKIRKVKELLPNPSDLYNLYLVEYRDSYVSRVHLSTLHRECDELVYVKDVLNDILEYDNLTMKNRKSIAKTILILERLLDDSEDIDDSILCEIDDLNKSYLKRVMED